MALTDSKGVAQFTVAPGSYRIITTHPEYDPESADVLNLASGELRGLTMRLRKKKATIQVTVVDDASSTPITGADVSASPLTTTDPVGQLIYEWFGSPFRSGLEYGWGAPWGRHEARLATNASWDWTEGARPAQWATPPPGYTAMSGWGQVVEAAGGIGPTRNFRVHVRWNRLYAFVNGVWHLVESTDQYGIQGGWFRNTDFSSASGYVSWRQEAEGFSVSWQSAPADTLLHWWINSWPHPLIPTGATAFYAVAQVRLIPDTDPNVDLSAVQVYGGVGNDWWSSPTGQGGPGTGIPRHKRLTAQWKTFASATIPTTAPPKNDPNYDYNTAVRSFSPMPPLFY